MYVYVYLYIHMWGVCAIFCLTDELDEESLEDPVGFYTCYVVV